MVLHLQQSAYGRRQSPLNFYHYLREGLENRVFKKSSCDNWLFIHGEFIVLFWVDDYIFYVKYLYTIDDTVNSLKDEFLIEREENMAGFLALQIQRDETAGTIILTQTGLIYKIVEAMGKEDSNVKYTTEDKKKLA